MHLCGLKYSVKLKEFKKINFRVKKGKFNNCLVSVQCTGILILLYLHVWFDPYNF